VTIKAPEAVFGHGNSSQGTEVPTLRQRST